MRSNYINIQIQMLIQKNYLSPGVSLKAVEQRYEEEKLTQKLHRSNIYSYK